MAWVELIQLACAALLVPLMPLLDGVRRKLYAVIQRRVGPPILQTWYDLLKLFGRVTSAPARASPLYWCGPLLAYALALLALLMLGVPSIYQRAGGLLALLLTLEASAAAIAAGALGLSPYTSAGAARLLLLVSVADAGLLVAAVLGPSDVYSRVLLAAGLLAATLVELELPPYNVAEAGPEIAAGPYTEYQGVSLALALWSGWLRAAALAYAAFGEVLRLNPLAALAATIAYLAVYYAVAPLFGRPRPLRAAGLAAIALVLGLVAPLL